ncbi:MAG: pilin, partial [Ostreibacterium sp.]
AETGQLRTAVETCILDGRTSLGIGAGQCDPGATASNLLDSTLGTAGFDSAGNPLKGTPEVFGSGSSNVTIVGTFGNNAAAILDTNTVTWTRDTMGSWICSSTVDDRYKPSSCDD